MKATVLMVAALLLAVAHANDDKAMTGWRPLLDEKTTGGWRGWTSEQFPEGWHVRGDTITKDGAVEDLISREQFGNFEVEFEWKVSKGGNAGFFYHGTREYDHIYWSAPEYQILDDAFHPDGKDRLTSAAAAYALYPVPAGIASPHDEWNKARVVVNGEHVEHWLNGQRVVIYELGSADWKQRVAASKFAAYPNFGLAKKGYFGIQGDHDGTLTVRHLRIRELP